MQNPIHVKITGEAEMERKLRAIIRKFPKEVARALHKKAEQIMTISKRDYCPVKDGILRGSGHVSQPKIESSTFGVGGDISVQLAYGGPAKAYAIVQHETEEFSHTVGEWKYLETPMNKAASSLASDLAKDIKL